LEPSQTNAIISKITRLINIKKGEKMMKQKFVFLLCCIGFGLLLAVSLIHDSNANAALSPEKAMSTTVNSYLNAIKIGDTDTMVKYTDDLRFPDKATQKENYKNIQKVDISNITIKSFDKMTETSYKVNVAATIQGKPQEFAVPVVNKYGMWLVVIGQPAA
jgi:hypothetical protein